MTQPITASLATLEDRAARIAGIIDDLKAEDVTVLDLRGVTDFADCFIIATARARVQMTGIIRRIYETLKAEGVRPISPAEDESPRWAILDYGDIVVHLFDPEAREHYRLEQAWGDAEEMDWRRLAPVRSLAR